MSAVNGEQENSTKSLQRKKFKEEFEQILSVEFSPQLWIAVQKQKSDSTMYVDIRRKKEGKWQGNKIFIPTQAGLFLRYPEYEKLRQKLETIMSNFEKIFEFTHFAGRVVSGVCKINGSIEVKLKTEYKETKIPLSRDEAEKLISNSVADGIASAMVHVIYE